MMRILLLSLIFSSTAWAQSGGGAAGPGTMHVAAMAMVLSSSTKQGGQGPEGSTILTHSEIQYNKGWWGAGVFFQYDKHGDSETDTAFGPKLELVYGAFFLELGFAISMNRSFTDRSIAEQTGSGLVIGPGVRFALGAASGGAGGIFFEASYKYRTQTLKEQDGVALSEKIEQTDGYPVFGLGYKF